jgi:hypothetical protein
MHRFTWDLRYPPPAVTNFSYPISAIHRNTPREPRGPWVAPGAYTVRLTVAGRRYTQPLTVRMDPRVKTPLAALAQQFTLSMGLYQALRQDSAALQQTRALRAELENRRANARGDVATAISAVDGRTAALVGSGGGFGGDATESLSRLNGNLAQLLDLVQDADVAPTTVLVETIQERQATVAALLLRWEEILTRDLPALNQKLRTAGLAEVRRNR